MPWVLVLFALFAGLFTLSKSALEYSEPFFLIGSRMLFAGILLLGHQFLFQRKNIKLKLNHILPLFLLGLVSIYITNIAEIWGLQFMSSSKACLIYSLSPYVAALFAYFMLQERLSLKKWVGLCIGFIGILPILFADYSMQSFSKEIFIFSRGEIALLIAVFASVYGWILLKKIINDFKHSPILANGFAMVIGGTFALFHSYLSGETWSPIPVINAQYAAYIECALWMTLISNIICYNLYGYLLKRFTATFMALAGLVTPLFATFFGWYFLNETITWHYFGSMIIFSIGLIIFYQEELQTNFDAPIEGREANS
ncbi:EamA family transporter [Candidatus Berkiella cookevillensis]|uniref:EamA family transporter n=1 Tax=Candidatus Berkiella cookevillensis TaxID=437022 RepID=A0A0Q9YAG8_9GAMM|nr:EamA family transporter [Candidatus Berkiella cookevillensis]MCS5709507.1 EamA family transporter [Candidatus Berkiella cookevillensis]